MLPRNTRQKRLCIARSHLFHVSLAFISLEHQLEAACKRYTCQAKRLALPAGSLFMDETSPRPKKRAERLNARFLRRLATRSFSSPEKSFLPPPLSVSFSLLVVSDRPYFNCSTARHRFTESRSPRLVTDLLFSRFFPLVRKFNFSDNGRANSRYAKRNQPSILLSFPPSRS